MTYKMKKDFKQETYMTQGTPSSLRQAFYRAVMICPMSEIPTKGIDVLQDFLAQRFTEALLKSDSEKTTKAIQTLWSTIIGENREQL